MNLWQLIYTSICASIVVTYCTNAFSTFSWLIAFIVWIAHASMLNVSFNLGHYLTSDQVTTKIFKCHRRCTAERRFFSEPSLWRFSFKNLFLGCSKFSAHMGIFERNLVHITRSWKMNGFDEEISRLPSVGYVYEFPCTFPHW